METYEIAQALCLEAPAARRGLDLAWLEASHKAPGSFFAALHGHLDATLRPGAKSRRGQGYDLFHDFVTRNTQRGLEALRVYEGERPQGQRWESISYDELFARCRRRALAWAARGVEPGSIVCIMFPAGIDAYVSLLAGLHLGACVSLLDPQGPDFMVRRLAQLGPAFVATKHSYLSWLGEHAESLGAQFLLEDIDEARVGEMPTYTYSPDEVCALLFSPLRDPPDVPIELNAQQMFCGALRDGAVALALRRGDQLAAPGFDQLQHQPCLLFAALLMGACWVELGLSEALEQPQLLLELELRSVGLRAQLREVLADASTGKQPPWRHIFKNPEEPSDPLEWTEFRDLLGLEEVVVSNILFEAASGGALLCSPRRKAKATPKDLSAEFSAHYLELCAAAGRAWALMDLNASGKASLSEVGTFTALEGVEVEGDEGAPSGPQHVVLARRRGLEYLYAGTTLPRRSGRVFPAAELLESLADCPFVQALSVIAVPRGGQAPSHAFILVGYVGHASAAGFAASSPAQIEELERVIGTRLGPSFAPDHIELFRGYARVVEGEVDHRWCFDQYVAGTTYRKHRSSLFHQLSAVRDAFAQQESGA